MVNWRKRHDLRAFWKYSFWLFPALGIVATLLAAPLIRSIDRATGWRWLGFTPDGARAILAAFSASMLTFIVFVVTSVLVVVQLASAQLTPRVITLSFENGRARATLTFFTIAFTYTIATSGRVEDTVPQLAVMMVVLLNLASIAVFFHFAHRMAVDLRPVSVLTTVANIGKHVVVSVYPNRFNPERPERCGMRTEIPGPWRVVTYEGSSGAILGFDLRGIVERARAADAIVELLPQVGDFISKGDPLFRVTPQDSPLDDEILRHSVASGPERTLEQDPRFVLRIVVDIANKGLSPAINDPTTAVLAIDQVHRLLNLIGSRRLDEGEARDAAGKLRLVFGTPDWDDYVALGVSEIRQYGSGSLQVARRLFAMLDHLAQVLPAPRHGPLRLERALLERSVNRAFPDPEDRATAAIGDSQGMGGSELTKAAAAAERVAPKPE